MGNTCLCVNDGEEDRSKTKESGKQKVHNNGKCVAAIIKDIDNGVTAIPSVGSLSWNFRPGCNSNTSLSANDMAKVGTRLCEAHNVTRLELITRAYGDGGATHLAKALKSPACASLTYLSISHNNIGDKGFQDIAQALQSNTTLTHLVCDGNLLGDQSVAALGECLEANRGLETIEMCIGGGSIPMTPKSVQRLGDGLARNASLRTFKLSAEHAKCRRGDEIPIVISPEEFGLLFDRMLSNRTLVNLHLRYLIGTDGSGVKEAMARCVAYVLQDGVSLEVLDLTGNIFGDAGGVVIADSLADGSKLRELHLGRNRLGDNSLVALGEVLKGNTRLEKLDISCPSKIREMDSASSPFAVLTEEGVCEFFALLATNSTLDRLNILDVPLTQKSTQALEDMVKVNTSLTDVRTSLLDQGALSRVSNKLTENQRVKIEQQAATVAATKAQQQTAPAVSCDADGPQLVWRRDDTGSASSEPVDEFIEVEFDDDD